MIPGQLTNPGVNFALVCSLTPVTVHISFSLYRGNFKRRISRNRVTHLAVVTFLYANRMLKLPRGKSSPLHAHY